MVTIITVFSVTLTLIYLLFDLRRRKKNSDIEIALIRGLLFGMSKSDQEDENGNYTFIQLAVGFIVFTLYYEHE